VIWQIGKLEERIKELASEVKRQADQLSAFNISMVKFKTAFYSIMVCLGVFVPVLGGIIWWSIGERIDAVLKPHWETPTQSVAPQIPPNVVSPAANTPSNPPRGGKP
jgi:hypothetical protein